GMAITGTPTCTYYTETVKEAEQSTEVKLATPTRLNFTPGERIDDFQLLTQLGRGSFAQVFLARQLSLQRLVALKISAPKGNEPQTLAQLDHPHIVRVFDLRQDAERAANLLYMEVVPGGTLYEVARRVREAEPGERSGRMLLEVVDDKLGASGVTSPENSPNRHWLAEATWPMVVCQLGAQLADGLAYAHSKGVMHRDIKPANVLLTPEGAPKLADFNVSYNGGRPDESPEDTFGGSFVYMSPEQLQACHPVLGGSPKLVRGASDVYSLGVMLWELLCGRRPFDEEGKDEAGVLARIQRMIDQRHYADFQELCRQLPRDCPESLRQVLVRCLQPRREERYQSAEEAARALRLCLQPRCWKLLQEPSNPLVQLLLQFPVPAVIVAGLTPNVLAGFFNYSYNELAIIKGMKESFIERFDTVQLVVNCVAFPLGLAIGVWAALRAMRLVSGGKKEEAAEGGRRVIFFGRFVSMFALVMWTIAGFVFPIAIDWGQTAEATSGFYLHFLVSLALCGFAAVAYPYFLLTAMAVGFYIPALVRNHVILGPRWQDLQRVRILNRVHLVISALVPMLGMGLVVAVGSEEKWPVLVLSGVGVIGFVAMFLLERSIDNNINALEKIAVEAPLRRG
ncbi:MAG: protein kinase, partial [Pirellulales bacterium]|nr:protein kinase [Pirellulales bacterium]